MADEQPIQAHLRNKPAKEPSAGKAVQPNGRWRVHPASEKRLISHKDEAKRNS